MDAPKWLLKQNKKILAKFFHQKYDLFLYFVCSCIPIVGTSNSLGKVRTTIISASSFQISLTCDDTGHFHSQYNFDIFLNLITGVAPRNPRQTVVYVLPFSIWTDAHFEQTTSESLHMICLSIQFGLAFV
jgi:hypothetical protein